MNFKEKMVELQKVIPIARENAIHLNEAARKMKISQDGFKRLVRMARKEGAFILSDSSGYWQSEDRAEIQEFIDSMEKQSKSRFSSVKSMRAYLNSIDGQMSIDDLEESEVKADNGKE